MTNLSHDALEVLNTIVELVEDNNNINDTKWSDWADALDIMSHFCKVDSDADSYSALSSGDKDIIENILKTCITTDSSPLLNV